MPRTLDVYLQRNLVGQLIQDEHGQMAFYYAESWLNNAGGNSAVSFAAAQKRAI